MQVQTLDGRTVWRKRHYRVRRAKQPGLIPIDASVLPQYGHVRAVHALWQHAGHVVDAVSWLSPSIP